MQDKPELLVASDLRAGEREMYTDGIEPAAQKGRRCALANVFGLVLTTIISVVNLCHTLPITKNYIL